MRVRTTGDPDSAFDALQLENADREREQRERWQAAEIERLDGHDYREFLRLRAEQAIAEPKAALDETSYRDYKLRRDAGES